MTSAVVLQFPPSSMNLARALPTSFVPKMRVRDPGGRAQVQESKSERRFSMQRGLPCWQLEHLNGRVPAQTTSGLRVVRTGIGAVTSVANEDVIGEASMMVDKEHPSAHRESTTR